MKVSDVPFCFCLIVFFYLFYTRLRPVPRCNASCPNPPCLPVSSRRSFRSLPTVSFIALGCRIVLLVPRLVVPLSRVSWSFSVAGFYLFLVPFHRVFLSFLIAGFIPLLAPSHPFHYILSSSQSWFSFLSFHLLIPLHHVLSLSIGVFVPLRRTSSCTPFSAPSSRSLAVHFRAAPPSPR